MNGQPRRPQPMAEALQWVSRITTVALMMLLPILGGRKLDEMRGTGYWGTVGLVFGLLLGAWQMRSIVVDAKRSQPTGPRSKGSQLSELPSTDSKSAELPSTSRQPGGGRPLGSKPMNSPEPKPDVRPSSSVDRSSSEPPEPSGPSS